MQLKLPRELLGWDYGTLEVTSDIKSSNLQQDIRSLRMRLRTNVSKGKLISTKDGWSKKKEGQVHLAVRKRYSSTLMVEFRKSRLGPDGTSAFAVIWLQDIPDEELCTLKVPVWRGNSERIKRAESCCESEFGEKLGHIDVSLRFWPGLSGYHKAVASKDKNIRDMVEVLNCANDEEGEVGDNEDDGGSTDDSDDSEDRDESEGSNKNHEEESRAARLSEAPKITTGGGTKEGGKRGDQQRDGYHEDQSSAPAPVKKALNAGPVGQLKDYAAHKGELHRRHRGLMQWQTPRTMKWMKTKAQHSGSRISARFGYKDREPDIETEV